MRERYQHAMRDDLVSAVEALTECKVDAFLSSSHVHPDLAVEVFVLDRPGAGRAGASRGRRLKRSADRPWTPATALKRVRCGHTPR
jgi:hypothetical protein